MRRRSAFAVVLLLATVRPAPLPAQQPTLADVLSRAAQALAALDDQSRLLACDERYTQKFDRIREMLGFEPSVEGGRAPVGSHSEVGAAAMDKREWTAEVVLLATPGNSATGFPWMEFRDVISVNQKPVGDGVSRLGILTTAPFEVAAPKAVQISQGAAAYLFGRLARVTDLPRAAILFLHPSNQPRFEFKKAGERTIDGVRTWEVKFRETRKPTIVRASGDKDSPSTGSFWIDSASGHVLMSVLRSADSSSVYDESTVIYQADAATGVWLPAELKERIVDEDRGLRVEATASFGNWRVVPRRRGSR